MIFFNSGYSLKEFFTSENLDSEVWLACYLLGFPISIIEALMLKSLTSTISDIAFFVPNAYGVQEGGYVMLGALLGMTPDIALAVSLATRIRELVVLLCLFFARSCPAISPGTVQYSAFGSDS